MSEQFSPPFVGGLEYGSMENESTASLLKFRKPDDRSLLINCKFI
ncbi:MAG: hypothetical protein ACTSWG_11125 [Candidatus Helarchaeota archaeon]